MNFMHGLFVTLEKCFTVPPAGVMIPAHDRRGENAIVAAALLLYPRRIL